MKDESKLTEIVFSVTSPTDWENEVNRKRSKTEQREEQHKV